MRNFCKLLIISSFLWEVWRIWKHGIMREPQTLAFTRHLSCILTLPLITATPLANARSLGTGSMCNRHKRREICAEILLAGAVMGSENLSGAKGNSHSQLNAHFASLLPETCVSSSITTALFRCQKPTRIRSCNTTCSGSRADHTPKTERKTPSSASLPAL